MEKKSKSERELKYEQELKYESEAEYTVQVRILHVKAKVKIKRHLNTALTVFIYCSDM